MISLFNQLSEQCSKSTTQRYSTSFYSAIRLLHKDLRTPIHNIYGFVRFADEIVDTFYDYNSGELLQEFKTETFQAIERGISLNPILNSFQLTVNDYSIEHDLILAFFASMESDLNKNTYDRKGYEDYIYGSAEVVGLMCLMIFCEKDQEKYLHLKPFAQSLGAAFQKVNFLRDIKQDYNLLNRTYFPRVDFNNFSSTMKAEIEADISQDFSQAYKGILQLPVKARFGVYVAYKYYQSLFTKIKKTRAAEILESRVRVPNYSKAYILARATLKNQLRLL